MHLIAASTAVACDKWCVQYSVSCGTFRGFNLRGGNSVGGESDVQSSQLYHHPPKVIFRSNRWWKLISIRPEPADDDGAVWHHSSAAASGRCAVIGVGTAHLTIYNSDPVICSCVDDVRVLCSSSSVVLSQWTSVGPSCRRWTCMFCLIRHGGCGIDLLRACWGVSVASDVSLLHVWKEFAHVGGGDTRRRWVTARFGWSSFTLISYCLHISLRPPRLSAWPALLSLLLHLPSFSLNWPSPHLCSHPRLHSLSPSLSSPRLCRVSESLLSCRGLVSSAEA